MNFGYLSDSFGNKSSKRLMAMIFCIEFAFLIPMEIIGCFFLPINEWGCKLIAGINLSLIVPIVTAIVMSVIERKRESINKNIDSEVITKDEQSSQNS